MQPWNIWQALAWLRWGDEKWCERYCGVTGGERYRAGIMYPKMPDPLQPAQIREPDEASTAMLEALRFRDLKVSPLQPEGFWLSREHLNPKTLPENIRFFSGVVQAMFPVPHQGAAEWMVENVKAAIEAGRPLKAKDAREQCVAATKCTTREADSAWAALSSDLKRTRGREKVSPL